MSPYRLWWTAGIVTYLIATGASPVAAQLPTYGVGRPPTTEEIKVWDLTIPPDGHGSLATDKPIRTIGSFWQYATTLWSYIRRAQPFDDPGSLTPDQVYAVTAYLLYLNGIIGEQDVMDMKTLLLVQMPNRDGFVPDPRPDVGPAAQQLQR